MVDKADNPFARKNYYKRNSITSLFAKDVDVVKDTIILLTTKTPQDSIVAANQRNIKNIFRGHDILVWRECDGASTEAQDVDLRDELFRISAKKGVYPQVFMETPSGNIDYVGDFDAVNKLNELDSAPPDDDVKGFKEVFKSAIQGRSAEEAADEEKKANSQKAFAKQASVKERMSIFSGTSTASPTPSPKKSSLKFGKKKPSIKEEEPKEEELKEEQKVEEKEEPEKPKRRTSLQMLKSAITPKRSSLGGRKNSSMKPDGFSLVGSGVSFEQMHDVLDEENASVYFGLLRFAIGDRAKMVNLFAIGENTPSMIRGKCTAMKNDAKALIGDTHVELMFREREEIHNDQVFETLTQLLDKDVTDSGQTKEEIKADFMKMVQEQAPAPVEEPEEEEEEQAAPVSAREQEKIDRALKIKKFGDTAMGCVPVPTDVEILHQVRQPQGLWNWVLFQPNSQALEVIEAGSGGIPEMGEYMKDDEACFGLVRVSFGTGVHKQTKTVFVTWLGPDMNIMKKGPANMAKGPLKEKLRPFHIDLSMSTREELEVAHICTEMRRVTVGSHSDDITPEQLLAALEEDKVNSALQAGKTVETQEGATEDEDERKTKANKQLQDLVDAVRKGDPNKSWVLVTPRFK